MAQTKKIDVSRFFDLVVDVLQETIADAMFDEVEYKRLAVMFRRYFDVQARAVWPLCDHEVLAHCDACDFEVTVKLDEGCQVSCPDCQEPLFVDNDGVKVSDMLLRGDRG